MQKMYRLATSGEKADEQQKQTI